MPIVPNRFPSIPSNLRIAVIGEAPGADEERLGKPFVGASGKFLAALLSRAGISIDACFVGNVCQHRPPDNNINAFSWHGLEIQHGLEKLHTDIAAFNPNIVVLLGNVPLRAAKDPAGLLKPKQQPKNSDWRGSLFLCSDERSPFYNRKCISTYHPAYTLRDYETAPFLQFDLKKAVKQASTPTLQLPKRELVIPETAEWVCHKLWEIRQTRAKVACDIEGYVDAMSCISFATAPDYAFIVPFFGRGGNRIWSPKDECEIWRELSKTLTGYECSKVLQNSLYDRFVLAYSYGIHTHNVVGDTMLAHWELYAELEKALDVQCSLYTDEPYYKGDRKTQDDRTFFEYCCRDSAVTLEIHDKLDKLLTGTSKEHYKLNLALLNPLLYMELRGIQYNSVGAATRREELRNQLFVEQARLNGRTGHGFKFQSHKEIKDGIYEKMLTVKQDRPYKEFEQAYPRVKQLLQTPSPTLATIGEIETLCQNHLNVNSSKQFPSFLYETLKLPVQFKEVKAKGGQKEPTITADYEALLKLSKICQQNNWEYHGSVLQSAIILRALGTREQMLSIGTDGDGRIRCGYNVVGTNTGRISCYESPTGSGYNLTTIPNYTEKADAPGGVLGDRDLFLADEQSFFFQCDLAGADGWTVAAYSAMLGDDTMLLDYRGGVRPFERLCLKLMGKSIPKERDALAAACKAEVKKDSWERFACKRVQHGGCYLEGARTVAKNILKDSEGKLVLSEKECKQMLDYFMKECYWGVPKWHDWVGRRLKEKPVLVAASGQVRQFFGRADEIITKAVAFEPQCNTTYATNLAMFKLWTDKENRVNANSLAVSKLRVEPLHQVHDALCGQFLKTDTPWAISKIQQWFANPLKIAGQLITIPFDGAYGESWGNLNAGKIKFP